MDRRNSIKLIIASAVAPAFIAEGLMQVKPIVVPDVLTIDHLENARRIFKAKMNNIYPNYFDVYAAIHPEMYKDLVIGGLDKGKYKITKSDEKVIINWRATYEN